MAKQLCFEVIDYRYGGFLLQENLSTLANVVSTIANFSKRNEDNLHKEDNNTRAETARSTAGLFR